MIQINDYSNIQLDGYGTYSYYDDDTNTYVTIPPEQVTPEMQRAVMNQQYGYQYQQQPVQDSYYYDPQMYYNEWYQHGVASTIPEYYNPYGNQYQQYGYNQYYDPYDYRGKYQQQTQSYDPYYYGNQYQQYGYNQYYDPYDYRGKYQQQAPNYQPPQQSMRDKLGLGGRTTDYYGNVTDPYYGYYSGYGYMTQEDIERQKEIQNHMRFTEYISKKVKHALGIVDKPQDPIYELSQEEQQKQYEKYIESKTIDHLQKLDNMINDDEYVHLPSYYEQQNIAMNLSRAKEEFPDDMSILDMFNKLVDRSVAREWREDRLELVRNKYDHNKSKRMYYTELPINSRIDKKIGCFEFSTNDNGQVNVDVNSEYMKAREEFLKNVSIRNDRLKGRIR